MAYTLRTAPVSAPEMKRVQRCERRLHGVQYDTRAAFQRAAAGDAKIAGPDSG